jgi:hypothetical protein
VRSRSKQERYSPKREQREIAAVEAEFQIKARVKDRTTENRKGAATRHNAIAHALILIPQYHPISGGFKNRRATTGPSRGSPPSVTLLTVFPLIKEV